MLQKNLLMQNTYKLKEASDNLKTMIVTHDLTLAEREQCKKVVSEAKEKQESDMSGEWVYRVRGPLGNMRVVSWRKGQ